MANHTQLYTEAVAELNDLRRSTSAKWLDRYVRFINETGKREEFLLWAAKDIGMDQETMDRLFPAEGVPSPGQKT